MKNKHSDSYRRRKHWQKRVCPNCLMNFIRDPDEKLCKDCIDDICDGIIAQMENEERGDDE